MAVNHIKFDDQTNGGRRLRRLLNNLEDLLDQFDEELATLAQMKDGGNVTQYIVDQYGFTDTTVAAAGVSEVESAYSKLSGDGSVDFVQTALRQVCNKLR